MPRRQFSHQDIIIIMVYISLWDFFTTLTKPLFQPSLFLMVFYSTIPKNGKDTYLIGGAATSRIWVTNCFSSKKWPDFGSKPDTCVVGMHWYNQIHLFNTFVKTKTQYYKLHVYVFTIIGFGHKPRMSMFNWDGLAKMCMLHRYELKMLGLHLDTLIIGNKNCSM